VDAVSWAQVVSPLVAAAGIIAAVVWAVRDRRDADDAASQDRWEAYRAANEERQASARLAATQHQSDLMLRVALAFERHQSGDPLAGADCKALLLAVGQRLPVTRLLYLGEPAWLPEDGPRIEAIASFYGLPVNAELARREIRHELQGTQFVVYSSDGAADQPVLPGLLNALPDGEQRQLRLRLRHAPRHARR
jgi:hypothetical protein